MTILEIIHVIWDRNGIDICNLYTYVNIFIYTYIKEGSPNLNYGKCVHMKF